METQSEAHAKANSEAQSQRIQLLDSKVIDQIAAGEVVERPAHLVKELIENSLDAGASEVVVDVSEGGRQITVTDNGRGIHRDDLEKALARHATSKISASEDLWKLNSFGFRGEALASISAVSQLTLVSRTAKEKYAAQVSSDFGPTRVTENIGHDVGTSVHVKDLFSNVPARLKFLRSDSAEVSQIKNVIKAMALAHEKCAFKFRINGELIFSWSVNAEKISDHTASATAQLKLERAKQVLDQDQLFFVENERAGFKVQTVFSDPHVTAKTSRQIWIFVQNRWVQDRSLQAAVTESYQNLLMHGEYPIAAVWVSLDPADVDVNIHPTKSQVKFADSSMAFRAVHSAIRLGLEKAPWITSEMARPQAASLGMMHPQDASLGMSQVSASMFTGSAASAMSFELNSSMALSSSQGPSYTNVSAHDKIQNQFNNQAYNQTLGFQDPELERAQYQQKFLANIQRELEPQKKSMAYWSQLQVLGQANQTYIVTQSREQIVIVDQHAAHERVNFEKLMRRWQGGSAEIQDFLFPLNMDLSQEKIEALESQKEALEKLGLFIERMGPETIGVKSAPAVVKDNSIAMVLEKVADDVLEHGASFSFEKLVSDLCATMACHSSIRAGQALSREEMVALLSSMDEFPLSSFCPHGRPVSVTIPFVKLEKDFGRIV